MREAMTPQQFTEAMRSLLHRTSLEPEAAHLEADQLMCELLRQLGYGEGIDLFDGLQKWYPLAR